MLSLYPFTVLLAVLLVSLHVAHGSPSDLTVCTAANTQCTAVPFLPSGALASYTLWLDYEYPEPVELRLVLPFDESTLFVAQACVASVDDTRFDLSMSPQLENQGRSVRVVVHRHEVLGLSMVQTSTVELLVLVSSVFTFNNVGHEAMQLIHGAGVEVVSVQHSLSVAFDHLGFNHLYMIRADTGELVVLTRDLYCDGVTLTPESDSDDNAEDVCSDTDNPPFQVDQMVCATGYLCRTTLFGHTRFAALTVIAGTGGEMSLRVELKPRELAVPKRGAGKPLVLETGRLAPVMFVNGPMGTLGQW
jgi:hypothetical protein